MNYVSPTRFHGHGIRWTVGLCGLGLVGWFAVQVRAADTKAIPQEQQIIHVLNRLGYGPRPGDVERVKRMGLGNYLQQQLYPERIDDSVVDRKLAPLDLLNQSNSQLYEAFRDDQRVRYERQRALAEAARQNEANNRPAMVETDTRGAAGNPGPSRIMLGVGELQEAKIIRAVDSQRQLYEVLVDFWSNHFNIDVHKGPCRVLKVADERDVIRPYVFGRFRDLLEASAKSPAMLVYLDNAQSSVARELTPMQQYRLRNRGQPQNPGAPAPADNAPRIMGGINENYAREIMELHTLGVDGGYTQEDVQEVARCFTGWTINQPTGEFQFTPTRHDYGEKVVLGHVIPANGGIQDGEMVLDILASHPSTARFIATKLCRRLVSDDPPRVIVDRAAAVFRQTGGDLRKVIETIVYSPEFYSPSVYRAKIKSPFEFAVSAVRATGGTVTLDTPLPLNRLLAMETGATMGRGVGPAAARRTSLDVQIAQLGQPLFAYQAPTGYPEDSRKWVSSGALISRMNFALALTEHNVIDALVAPSSLMQGVDIDKPDLVLDRLNRVLLQGELTAPTRATLEKQALSQQGAGSNTINVPQLTALILGSPEFQRH